MRRYTTPWVSLIKAAAKILSNLSYVQSVVLRHEESCGTIVVMKDSAEIERLLSSLTRAEKAELLRWVAQDLGEVYPGIESTPSVCGGAACIVRTRIPVWLLEQSRRHGTSDAELLSAYPQLRAEDLANAWAYVRSHRKEIETEIDQNEAA